ncbi:MAG: LamG domain-containing protein [Candidatus Saccharicenans sp.]|uniref:LamG domain-containing protein n=1 Tax=Candidatus Saccharicenans sp. TaxID=2819258 RepID=UPI00404A62B1
MKKVMVILILALMVSGTGWLARAGAVSQKNLLAWWKLDNVKDKKTSEAVRGQDDLITGNYKLVSGVSGQAIRFDGFTTQITKRSQDFPVLDQDFSLEAWVAPAAYPWNWCPVVAQHRGQEAGFYFGLGPRGEVGLGLALDGRWQMIISEEKIPLRKWSQIAASFDHEQGVKIYINGRLVKEERVLGKFVQAMDSKLIIGMNYEKVTPSDPVRPQATLPARYSFDGIIDEIRIYGEALDELKLSQSYASAGRIPEPDIPPRLMPSGRSGPGRFGAYYTRLNYYEEWEALWRVGDYADVVVEFDNSPIRVVFWRGTRYSPVWVMENGQWMADQSAESFTDEDGCFEHMLDAKCLYSHVRIIENTPARVVVHWRYIPVSVRQKFSQVDDLTGWPDATDEYYAFYPDGIGVRKIIMYTSGKPLGPQETIILCQPGTRPEDNVNMEAITLVNLKGQSQVYSWASGPPKLDPEKPVDPVIQVVNLKSKAKPFLIFEPGCRMRVFGIEVRGNVSPFPWWNHWPVAQIPSDGRYAQAPDRASHFSLAWGGPPIHKGEGLAYWGTWIYGTTEDRPEKLADLAKSWIKAPELVLSSPNFEFLGYDRSQRAYVLKASNPGHPASLKVVMQSNQEQPLHNLCLIIKDWGEKGVQVSIDGKKQENGKGFRFGNIRKMEVYDLVIWVEKKSSKPVNIEIQPQ